MERRIAVRAVIIQDNKMLCVKLKAYRDSRPNEFWCTIGGGLDPGESLIEGLKREVIEEVGVVPEVGNLLFVQQYRNEKQESIEFFFHVTNTEDFMNIDLSKTTHGTKEIGEIEFIDPKTENILPRFLSEANLEDPTNQTTQVFNFS
jgi:8-oxo-dGTP pyrophosphatase MutT (NUDIX family)